MGNFVKNARPTCHFQTGRGHSPPCPRHPASVGEEGVGLVLKPGDFYLLASKEWVSVPPNYAAEMVSYDPSIGEFTVHYAGFFDPGFGHGPTGEIRGTKAVLEVRAHEVPILLEDGQEVGRLTYFKMAATPDKIYGQGIGSSYQQQGLALSKQFKALPKPDPSALIPTAST